VRLVAGLEVLRWEGAGVYLPERAARFALRRIADDRATPGEGLPDRAMAWPEADEAPKDRRGNLTWEPPS